LPEHYEPMESPVKNIINSQNLNPTVKIIPFTKKEYGNREKYPYIATLYQISEHWQAGGMTRNLPWLTELVPNMFCEISPELAKKKGIMNGDRVRITSARGSIKSYALVTERIQPFNINGEIQEMIGLIWHFGFSSDASGDIANILTPHIGDPNTMIPEFKAFLVDIKKV
ncbi:MAG: formate dehydrogenase subunit alpha, partial [Spirochaetota bacterium]|nr:formate dehydrogenase subunit alpha [Spirochaetota bacterium]